MEPIIATAGKGFTTPDGPYRRCWRWVEAEQSWEEVRVQHLKPGDRVDFEDEPGSRLRHQCIVRSEPYQGPGDRWGVDGEHVCSHEV